MPISVKGRLRDKLAYRRDVLHASLSVLRVIESGYVLPLLSEPTHFHQSNQALTLGNAELFGERIAELVSSGCVREVEGAPAVCSPLSVVENSGGKKRLLLNLHHLNIFFFVQAKFLYEDLRVAMLLLKKGDCMLLFDLKSGYHHIDTAQAHHIST